MDPKELWTVRPVDRASADSDLPNTAKHKVECFRVSNILAV